MSAPEESATQVHEVQVRKASTSSKNPASLVPRIPLPSTNFLETAKVQTARAVGAVGKVAAAVPGSQSARSGCAAVSDLMSEASKPLLGAAKGVTSGASYAAKEMSSGASYAAKEVSSGASYAAKSASSAARRASDAIVPKSLKSAKAARTLEEEAQALRSQLAPILYPSRGHAKEQEAALLTLEADLASKAPPALREWWSREPAGEELEEASAVAPSDSPLTQSATKVQAMARGLAARKKAASAASLLGEAAAAEGATAAASTGSCVARVLRAAGLAAIVAALLLLGYFGPCGFLGGVLWALLLFPCVLCLAIYGWLRAPSFLGVVGTKLITDLALQGVPLGFKTVRARPWITLNPLTIWVDVHAYKFFLGNAVHISCRDKDMVRAEQVQVLASVRLDFLERLRTGLPIDLTNPIVVDVHSLLISDVIFNMMLGSSGIFNLYAIATTINEGEIRGSLPKGAPMPNVVRLKILAARKLIDLPNLKPRIEVSIRKAKVSTAQGRRATETNEAGDGSTTVYHFGAEVTLPTPHAESVVVVRVYNDNVGLGRSPCMIGQWFMTLKWLWQCPEHCKHRELTATGQGGIAGTFLLTDAKLHGSAVRHLGPHTLKHPSGTDGFCGELDMALQWTHTTLLDPPKPRKPTGAIEQLGSTGDDDTLRFGNWKEFKGWLHGVPIRFDIDHFAIRRLTIEMSDLFVGAGAGVADGTNNAYVDNITFKRFNRVSMYEFFEVLATQVIKSVALDLGALYGATAEVFSGLTTNLSGGARRQLNSGLRSLGNAARAGADASKQVASLGKAKGSEPAATEDSQLW